MPVERTANTKRPSLRRSLSMTACHRLVSFCIMGEKVRSRPRPIYPKRRAKLSIQQVSIQQREMLNPTSVGGRLNAAVHPLQCLVPFRYALVSLAVVVADQVTKALVR